MVRDGPIEDSGVGVDVGVGVGVGVGIAAFILRCILLKLIYKINNMVVTLDKLLLERLVYVSHPSVSGLECSINLYKWSLFEVLQGQEKLVPAVGFGQRPKLDPRGNKEGCIVGGSKRNDLFYNIASEIIEMTNVNPKQVKINISTYSILFKDVAAMKLLNVLFKYNKGHALYPIYLKWLEGSEWMSTCC